MPINEDGEWSEPLEPHERRFDPDVHKMEDNREFSTKKRIVKPDPQNCVACGADQKFVKDLCHNCYNRGGATFEAQPTGMWEIDEPETKERVKAALHPSLDKWGRGFANINPVQFGKN